MSKKNIYIILSLFISSIYFAQTDTLKAESEISLNTNTFKKTKTLKLSSTNLSEKTLGEMKDELIIWKEKVISIEIDEQAKEFKLIHNHLMEQAELFEVLQKYDIKKENIISYK